MKTRHETPPMRRLRGLCATAALALLAACGGGGAGDDPAPAEPPVVPLGNAVTATVGPAGGTVVFTASGVAGRLVIPAGALAADTAITVTPVAPGAEEWARVDVSGIDTVLEQPATLTLTLPAGSTLDAAAAVTQLGTEGDVLLPSSIDAAARQVVVPVQRFRAGARTVELAADRKHALAASPGAPASTLILNQRLLVRLRVITAESRYQQLVRAGDYSSTLELSMSIAALLQSSGLDGYDAAALPWLQRAQTGACENLRGAMTRAESEPAPTSFDLEGRIGNAFVTRLSAPVLYWSKVANLLGGSCPGLNPSAALTSVHERLLGAIADKLVERGDLASLKGAVGEAAAAAALKRQADTLAAVQRAQPLGDDRSQALGATAAHDGRRGPLDAATNPAMLGAQIRDEVMTPALAPIRTGIWKGAVPRGTTDDYRRSLQIYGPSSPLADDLQMLGTTARVGSYADTAGTLLIEQGKLGREATPQASVKARTVSARKGGKLKLDGPVEVLKCPAAADETLVVDFDGHVVLTRPSVGTRLLDGSLDFEVDSLLSRAGIPPEDASRHLLRLRRIGSGCNGAFGVGDATVAEITLDFRTRLGVVPLPGGALDALAGDPTGHLFVVGRNATAFGLTGPAGAFVAKLDASMKAVWIVPYTATGRGVTGLGVDAAGNITLGGNASSADGGDVFATRIDGRTGAQTWDRLFGTASTDWAGGFAVDRHGNGFLVGGTGAGLAGGTWLGQYDAFIAKLDTTGAVAWAHNLGTDSSDGAHSVAVDDAGNAYMNSYEASGTKLLGTWGNTDNNQVIYKFRPDGTRAWRSVVDSDYREGGRGIGVTGGGVVLAMGIRHLIENDTGTSVAGVTFLRRIDAATGAGGSSNTSIGDGAMARDAAGHVCSVGRNASYSAPDYRSPDESLLRCFGPDGSLLWSKTIANAEVMRVAIDGTGVVTIAGIQGEDETGFYARYRLRDGSP